MPHLGSTVFSPLGRPGLWKSFGASVAGPPQVHEASVLALQRFLHDPMGGLLLPTAMSEHWWLVAGPLPLYFLPPSLEECHRRAIPRRHGQECLYAPLSQALLLVLPPVQPERQLPRVLLRR